MLRQEDSEEVMGLKKKVMEREQTVENLQNANVHLAEELRAEKATRKDLEHRVHQETHKFVQSELALNNKIEDYKVCYNQKLNGELALSSAEKDLKDALTENKRLEHQIGLGLARSSELQVENTRLSQAALLAKAVPPRRLSVSTAEKPQTTNRFGFKPSSADQPATENSAPVKSAAAGPRSSSAHGNYPVLATANRSIARRSSISSAIPTPSLRHGPISVIDPAKIGLLEREIADSNSRGEQFEKQIVEIKAKLSNKERDLLTLENRLMATERDKEDVMEMLKARLADATDEVEEGRRELIRAKDLMRVEVATVVNHLEADKSNLQSKLEKKQIELERKEAALEKSEREQEDMESELERAKEDLADVRNDLEAAKARSGETITALRLEHDQLSSSIHSLQEQLSASVESGGQLQMQLTEIMSTLAQKSATIEVLEKSSGGSTASPADSASNTLGSLIVEGSETESVDTTQATASDLPLLTDTSFQRELPSLPVDNDSIILGLQSEIASKDADILQLSSINSTSSQELSSWVAALSAVQLEKDQALEMLEKVQHEFKDTPQALQVSTSRATMLEEEVRRLEAVLEESQERIEILEGEVSELRVALLESQEKSIAFGSEAQRLEETVAGSEQEIDGLKNEVSELSLTLAGSQEDAVRFESSTQQLEEMAAVLQSKIVEMEASAMDLNTASAAAEEISDRLAVERRELESSLAVSSARIIQLELGETSRDVSQGLKARILELEVAEIATTSDVSLAQEALSNAQATIDTLETSFHAAKQELDIAQTDSSTAKEHLVSVEERIIHVEGQLQGTTLSWNDLKEKHESLESSLAEFAITTESLERNLSERASQLRDVQNSSEETEAANLIEVRELYSRLERHEKEIAELKTVVDELQFSLTAAEQTHSVTLDDLAASTSLRIATMTSEAGANGNRAAELESQLSNATSRVQAAEGVLSRLREELSAAVTTSRSESLAFSCTSDSDREVADTSRQVVLVTRLREERDELWNRLKFNQVEAQFRCEGLEGRLLAVTNAKEQEICELENKLAGVGEVRDIEAARLLEEAQLQVALLERELSVAKESLRGAEKKLVEFESVVLDAKNLEAELSLLHNQVSALEEELRTGNAEVLLLRSQIDVSTATNVDLLTSISDLELELDEAQKVAASAADDKSSVLGVLSALRETILGMESDKTELEAKLLRRTQQIASSEHTISLLQANQLMAEDDADDTAEFTSFPPTASQQDLDEARSLFEAEKASRVLVDSQLALVGLELEGARIELARLEVASSVLSKSHATHVVQSQLALDEAGSRYSDLEARYVSNATALQTLEAAHSDRQAEHSVELSSLQATLETKAAEVSAAFERVASAEEATRKLSEEKDLTSHEATVEQEKLEQLEKELFEANVSLNKATVGLKSAEEEVSRLTSELAGRQLEVVQLREEVAQRVEELEDAAEEMEALASEHEALSQGEAEHSITLAKTTQLHDELAILLEASEATVHQLTEQLQVAGREVDLARESAEQSVLRLRELESTHLSETTHRAEIEAKLAHLLTAQEELTLQSSQLEEKLDGSQQQTLSLEADLALARFELAEEVQQKMEREHSVQGEIRELGVLTAKLQDENEVLGQDLATSIEDAEHLAEVVRTSSLDLETVKADCQNLDDQLVEHQLMSDARTTELLDLLERLQQDKADAEARISESSDRIAGMEAAMRESSAASDRVAELEKQLEERTVEIEESDEKYIEVLRNQKRNLAQIERLKAKCEGLQRDLVSIREHIPLPTSPIKLQAPSPAASKRKREIDPYSGAPLPPRAVVAQISRTPSKSLDLQQENNSTLATSLKVNAGEDVVRRKSSGKKEANPILVKSVDGMVPLKPAAPSPERKVLGHIRTNSATRPTSVLGGKSEGSIVDLKARLAGLKSVGSERAKSASSS